MAEYCKHGVKVKGWFGIELMPCQKCETEKYEMEEKRAEAEWNAKSDEKKVDWFVDFFVNEGMGDSFNNLCNLSSLKVASDYIIKKFCWGFSSPTRTEGFNRLKEKIRERIKSAILNRREEILEQEWKDEEQKKECEKDKAKWGPEIAKILEEVKNGQNKN